MSKYLILCHGVIGARVCSSRRAVDQELASLTEAEHAIFPAYTAEHDWNAAIEIDSTRHWVVAEDYAGTAPEINNSPIVVVEVQA